MTNFHDAFPSKYLKAEDFPTPQAVEIDAVDLEDLGFGQHQERKLVVHFVDLTKGLVLNRINAETIAEISGTEEYDQWPGQVVVLYQTKTEFQGKRVPCIRVREQTPTTSRPKRRAAPDADDTGLEEVGF